MRTGTETTRLGEVGTVKLARNRCLCTQMPRFRDTFVLPVVSGVIMASEVSPNASLNEGES